MEANTVLPITPERQRIVWDAAMNLFLLRQIRGTGNPFFRGSTAMEEVVVILSQQDQRYSGLRKKGRHRPSPSAYDKAPGEGHQEQSCVRCE